MTETILVLIIALPIIAFLLGVAVTIRIVIYRVEHNKPVPFLDELKKGGTR